jgi:flagellar M-ring protein FliF
MSFLQNIFSRIKGWFSGIWEKTEKRDRTRFLVISAIALVLIIGATVMLNNNRFTELLVSENQMSLRAASVALNDEGIRNRIQGNAIIVNKNDELDARVALQFNQNNLDINDLDFSIYEAATGITSTESDRRMARKHQKQAELKRAFETLPVVNRATIMIEQPIGGGSIFDPTPPDTVSVVLHLNAEIDRNQIEAFEKVVVNATGIAPEHITLVDQNVRHLNKIDDVDNLPGGPMYRNYEFQQLFQRDLAHLLSQPLHLLYGTGNYNVSVNAHFDFDSVSSESVLFSPVVGDDEGIARSISEMTEYARGLGVQGGQPGTDENGLGDVYAEVDDQMWNEYSRTETIINNEITEIRTRILRAPYKLTDLRASVTINSDNLEDDDQNTAAVQSLIGAAIGYDSSQFRDVVVNYLPLYGLRAIAEAEARMLEEKQREEMYALIQTLVLYGIVGICVVILVLRAFVLLRPKPVEIMAEPLMAGDVADYSGLLDAAEAGLELEVTKTPTRERIEEFIDSNPDAVANMLRNWLQDEDDAKW